MFKIPLRNFYDNIPCGDATVTKLDPTGTQAIFTVPLGGNGDSGGRAIASDPGNIYNWRVCDCG